VTTEETLPKVQTQELQRTGLRTAAVVVLALAAAGCRPSGDFGRYDPSYFYDTAVPSVRHAVGRVNGNTSSGYALTVDEEELRARSRTLRELEGGSIQRDLDEVAYQVGGDERDYQRERRVEHASGVAVLIPERDVRAPDQLLGAISQDLELLDPYEQVVVRVYDADMARLATLRDSGDVPADDVLDTTARVKENRLLVDDTILAMHNRIDDYEQEMRRSLLMHPNGSERDIANAIGRLAHRVHKLERRVRSLSDPYGAPHFDNLAG
jgi:hypothetical protein